MINGSRSKVETRLGMDEDVDIVEDEDELKRLGMDECLEGGEEDELWRISISTCVGATESSLSESLAGTVGVMLRGDADIALNGTKTLCE